MSSAVRLLAPVLVLTLALAGCAGASSPKPATSSTPAAPASVASVTPASPDTPATAAPAVICTDAAAFRASLLALTNLKVTEVGASGVKTALTDLQSSAEALRISAKDLVAQPLTDLLAAVQGLQTTLTGLAAQASPNVGATVLAVAGAIEQIKTAAAGVETTLETACPAP